MIAPRPAFLLERERLRSGASLCRSQVRREARALRDSLRGPVAVVRGVAIAAPILVAAFRAYRTVTNRPDPAAAVRSGLNKEKLMKTFKSTVVPFLSILAVAGIMGCASTSRSEGTGEYVDDTVITTKVKAAILQQPTLKSTEINVETFKGVVQLSGFVTSQDNVNVAVATARGVKGVSSVKNDMRVK